MSALDAQGENAYSTAPAPQSSQTYGHFSDQPTSGARAENPYAYIGTRARVAIYDDLMSAPRVVDIEPAPILDFIENIATTTYDYSKKQGGELPYTVIREIAENFIHANFKECTVSILDGGNTIHFSDQGPGIEKKRLVLQPGVSSAVSEMKHFIRGVGSGLPIVKEYLEFRRGQLSIEDNARGGVIITLSIQPEPSLSREQQLGRQGGTTIGIIETGQGSQGVQGIQSAEQSLEDMLDKRSIKALRLFYEKGILGPSDLTAPLKVSVATAHRILVELEKHGLIEQAPNRKRILSNIGEAYFSAET